MQITEVEATVGEEDVDKSLQTIEKVVTQIEKEAPNLDPLAVKNLRAAVTEIGSRLTEEQKLALWKLSYRIWNTCVEISNDRKDGFREQEEETHARLRHISCDILLLAGEVAKNIKSGLLKTAYFFFKVRMLCCKDCDILHLARSQFCLRFEVHVRQSFETDWTTKHQGRQGKGTIASSFADWDDLGRECAQSRAGRGSIQQGN